ncbi:MAG: DEAD/DEAH box helicase [Pseudobdellovibrionaceae bacterium]
MKFSELNLDPVISDNITKMGYQDCTPIQEQAIPIVMQGRDLAGLAQTGTGKTAAFLLPLIHRILLSRNKTDSSAVTEAPLNAGSVEPILAEQAPPIETNEQGTIGADKLHTQPTTEEGSDFRAEKEKSYSPSFDWKARNFILILVPTRELAEQVQENADKFMVGTGLRSVTVYGGTGYDKQKEALRNGVEFVVATPGRLIDLFKDHVVDLKQVKAIVFDEADRMFDMGFKDDMKFILQRVPRDRQFLVFSATLNFEVLNTAYQFGADPVEINMSRDQARAENVKDVIFHIGHQEKPQHLLSILSLHKPKQAIIFTNFKNSVEGLAQFLVKNGFPAMAISSLLTQGQRNNVLEQFKAENHMNILVATDVAARGLDVKGVDLVVNYELPSDSESYVHRIGRTGRAGTTGQAFSLVCDRDIDALYRIEDYLKHKLTVEYLDDQSLIKDFKPLEYRSFENKKEFKPYPQRSQQGPRPVSPNYKGNKPRTVGGNGDSPYEQRAERGGSGSNHRSERDGGRGKPYEGRGSARPNPGATTKNVSRFDKTLKAKEQTVGSQHKRPARAYSNTAAKQKLDVQNQGLGQKIKSFFKNIFSSDTGKKPSLAPTAVAKSKAPQKPSTTAKPASSTTKK